MAGFDAFGGFGEVVTAAAELFVPLPAGLPADRGCLLEPVSCCVYAVRRGAVPAGATVLVTGAGSNGLMIAAVARKAGAGRVIVSEPDARRRGLALALGADEALDPAGGSLTEALRDEVISVAFESAGSPAALQDCLDVVADDGRVVMFGVHRDTAMLRLPLYGEIAAAFDAARSASGLKVIVYPDRPPVYQSPPPLGTLAP